MSLGVLFGPVVLSTNRPPRIRQRRRTHTENVHAAQVADQCLSSLPLQQPGPTSLATPVGLPQTVKGGTADSVPSTSRLDQVDHVRGRPRRHRSNGRWCGAWRCGPGRDGQRSRRPPTGQPPRPLPPGCSARSATTHTDTPTPRPARATPAPPRSPAPRAPNASCWPATPATDASAMPAAMGVLLAARLTRCPRLLPAAPRPKHRAPGRPTPTRQPAPRHPPRLPQDPDPLRRTHRLGTHPQSRLLTSLQPGMSAAVRAVVPSATDQPPVGILRRQVRDLPSRSGGASTFRNAGSSPNPSRHHWPHTGHR
jgi:hypothetical protein